MGELNGIHNSSLKSIYKTESHLYYGLSNKESVYGPGSDLLMWVGILLLPSVASSMVLMLHTICLANHHRIPHPKLLAPLFFGRRTSETDSCKVPSLFIMKIKGIIIFRSSSVIGNFRLQRKIPDDLVLDFRKKISAGTALSSVSCHCTRLSLTPGCHFKE